MAAAYHMLDYIHESPDSLRKTLLKNKQSIKKIAQKCGEMGINKVVLSGVGSSFTSAMMAWPIFQTHCSFPTIVVNSEETNYYADRWIDSKSLVVVVSRSGERGAVIDTLKLADKKKALGVAITGTPDSLLAQTSKLSLITQEGPEITFPKTKSVIACTGILMKLGLELADPKDKQTRERKKLLDEIPEIMKDFIQAIEPQIQAVLPEIMKRKMVNVVGTCSNYGAALEAAIKIQESSYIPTRGNSTAGLLQGPVGALNKAWLVFALVMNQDLELSKQLMKLTKGFHAYNVAVHPRGLFLGGLADQEILTPKFDDPYLAALVYLPAIQLLAYYWTVQRGMNPDAPSSMESILETILPPGRQEPELKK